MAWDSGWSPPPAAPCSTRKKINIPRVGAKPHKTELSENKKIQSMKKRLRPKKSASQPLIGSTIALETRYEVNTQVLSLLLAPRLPAMWGKATLAISVSRTSIKAAKATTIPINQGLYFGFQT